METHAERFRYLIQEWNLSQEDFGKLCGLKRGTVGTIVNGKTTPEVDALIKLKQVKPKLRWDWLLLGQGDPFEKGDAGEEAQQPGPTKKKPSEIGTPGLPLMKIARITPEEAVAIQMENVQLRKESADKDELIAELRADKGRLWKQNDKLLEKKSEASADAAPLTETVDDLALSLFNPAAAAKRDLGFVQQGRQLRVAV